MEKNLTIIVRDELIDLINKIEAWEQERGNSTQFLVWQFGETGLNASGLGMGFEYDVVVGQDWNSVIRREFNKHDNENWETHPFDSDYEED
jgi:hypothetical protein